MFSVEKYSNNIARYISKELDLNSDNEEVIAYGLISFLQTILSIFCVMFLGIIFGVFIESVVVSFTISILRRSSGGVHATTPKKCAIIGALVSVIIALLCNKINISDTMGILFGMFIFVYSFLTVKKLAPVDSIKKPIIKKEKIIRLKKKSLLTILIYFLIVVLNYWYIFLTNKDFTMKYNFCIYFGLLWQSFSLTKTGHNIVERIDRIL